MNANEIKHVEWQEVVASCGPNTVYGRWEGVKVFSIYYGSDSKSNGPKYVLKSMLPGFRPDLPRQISVEAAKAFAEKMLTRWVAKRGLLFKSHIVVTDAMRQAAFSVVEGSSIGHELAPETLDALLKAALAARG